ncbi:MULTISPECIES: type II toxin-antitoxin system RelE/ParE family toxin [Arcobacteraceae]|uniref:Plasmid stabilization protein n=1 Tax=Poseidonibacter parvus TaxID=1850254 RepID=A0A1P8KQS7_9BACT|nr:MULTISPECIES: type II toxin-antitoxin system mRNA interferase toxin, RelE/StbE family [Arcobacteraceae]APW66873.1 plasmid stabilization protein [Poseidonibacter parvus]
MSYKLLISDEYKKKLKKFFKKHPDMLDRYAKCIFILEQDPYHPSLRLHKLKGKLSDFHSISINMEYRVIIDFIIRDDEIIPVDIRTHDDVY